MSLGLAGYGVLSMFLGDTKGEHVDLVQAMGGSVFRLGPNRDYINVLDIGQALAAERRLRSAGLRDHADEVRADADRRRLILVETLISIARKGVPVTDRETAILGEALTLLERRGDTPPVLPDLVALIESRPEALRRVALDRGDAARYQDITENLVVSLRGLTAGDRSGRSSPGSPRSGLSLSAAACSTSPRSVATMRFWLPHWSCAGLLASAP